MAIQEFSIQTFSKSELSTLRRISKKRESGKKITAQDLGFEKWYDGEAQRQYECRENLKEEGWALSGDEKLAIEDRVRGCEMICYAHWHRAYNEESFPIALLEYAGCWVQATAPDLWSDPWEKPLLEILQQRYPLKGKRRLKRGYTYVWEVK